MEAKGRDAYVLGIRSELEDCGLELGCFGSGCLRRHALKLSLKFKGWSLG